MTKSKKYVCGHQTRMFSHYWWTAHGRLPANAGLKFLTGKRAKYSEINIARQVTVIGNEKCKGLICLDHFSGADSGGKFVGLTKKRWVNAYMK